LIYQTVTEFSSVTRVETVAKRVSRGHPGSHPKEPEPKPMGS